MLSTSHESRVRELGPLVITVIVSTPFWSKKVKIAILTLATFAALC